MLELNLAKWSQTPEDLRVAAMTADHARTRERFLALYELTQQGRGASAVARGAGRHQQTLIRWVHRYNESGPQALVFEYTGGLPPFLTRIPSRHSMP
jgi:transposase